MTYTVKNLMDRFAVGQHTILEWIRRAELRAINVSRRPGGRPQWRVTEEALREFEVSRMPSPPPERVRRKRRQCEDAINFY